MGCRSRGRTLTRRSEIGWNANRFGRRSPRRLRNPFAVAADEDDIGSDATVWWWLEYGPFGIPLSEGNASTLGSRLGRARGHGLGMDDRSARGDEAEADQHRRSCRMGCGGPCEPVERRKRRTRTTRGWGRHVAVLSRRESPEVQLTNCASVGAGARAGCLPHGLVDVTPSLSARHGSSRLSRRCRARWRSAAGRR